MARGRKKESDTPALEPISDPEDRAAILRDCKDEYDLLENKRANQLELVKAVNKQIGNMFRRLKTQLGITRESIEHHFGLLNIEDEDVRAARLAEMRELYRALPLGEQAELFLDDGDSAADDDGVVQEASQDAAAGFTFEQGKQAGLAGKQADDNPFAKRLKAHHTWEAGRMAGQAELAHDMDPETGSAAEPAESERRPRGRKGNGDGAHV